MTTGASALAAAPAVVARIESASDMASVEAEVRAFGAPLGYDRFVLYTASAGDGVDLILWLEGDWFGEGGDVDPRTYLARCPVNRHVLEIDRPFFWTKHGRAGEETYRVTARPKGAGIHGLQVPIFSHAGLVGALSFGGEAINSSAPVRAALTLVADAAFHAARRVGEIDPRQARPVLSGRATEVLRWVASGRRQADIALQLGLSERTVENHLRRIRKRLGASSTAQAVRMAMQAAERQSRGTPQGAGDPRTVRVDRE